MHNLFTDRKFSLPRQWSNDELKKFAHLFSGSVVNVSGWKDEDKQGATYKSYFSQANSYQISNYVAEARGLQGQKNEFFLDLTKPLPKKYHEAFDVAFNHTTLEHIFDIHTAFSNIVSMTKDIMILVVPFVQQMHADYGDFWRFTPMVLTKLCEQYGITPLYLSFNNQPDTAVYIFLIASKHPENWTNTIPKQLSYQAKRSLADTGEPYVGVNAIRNPWSVRLLVVWRKLFKKLFT